MTVLGIQDPAIWSVYLLCILSAAGCFVYGVANWNKGDDAIYPEDIKWVRDEKAADEQL
jgi:hypothetical protein